MPRLLLNTISLACVAGALLTRSACANKPANEETGPFADIVPQTAQAAALLDYGLGPGIKPARTTTADSVAMPPAGGASAGTQGVFGAPVQWPIIPIHMVLLPDGRVMNYGSNVSGGQGAFLYYDIWTPTLGTGSKAHLRLPNTTHTDIFCAGQMVLPGTGTVLVTGGDLTIAGHRNFSQNLTELFTPSANTLTSIAPMQYARWYPSLVAMPDGEILALGGRSSPTTWAIVPEIYSTATGWRALTGAYVPGDYAVDQNWYYPRGFLTSSGSVFVVGSSGSMSVLTTVGQGTIQVLSQRTAAGDHALPTIMYAPDQVLSVRLNGAVEVMNISGPAPVITPAPSLSQNRFWSTATVMADGRVLVSGGSLVANLLQGVAYQAQIWDPASNTWTAAASATIPRLYHSAAMLLPDGTVVTGGGGAPGPVNNLNAEIYYPPYLYLNDGSGQLAPRPSVTYAQSSLAPGGTITGTVGAGQQIGRVTFVRTGSVTHSAGLDQRLLSLPFTQTGQQLVASLPAGPAAPPGYYMIFAFNTAGVPAIASIVLVPVPSAVPSPTASAATHAAR